MVFHSDNVESKQYVWLTRYYHSLGHHRIIKIWDTSKSLNRGVIGFAVRKCIKKTWINAINNFRRPPRIFLIPGVQTIINGYSFDTNKFNLFINDCFIYTLFNSSNRMTAKPTNNNQWFWISKSYVSDVANGDYKNIDKLGNSNIYNSS